jgi:phosphopantothenoylcysteine synthetase/decarboxylase
VQAVKARMTGARPVLYLVACGARPAADLPDFVGWSTGQGWDTCVVLTPFALRFADTARLAELTGHPVRSEYKRPEEPDVLPAADAFAVAPATFNTINKWAAGISDTLALGLLNEALCSGSPITAVPNPNATLARHPAFKHSVEFLRANGVNVLFDPAMYPLPSPNLGEASRGLFPWEALKVAVAGMFAQVR